MESWVLVIVILSMLVAAGGGIAVGYQWGHLVGFRHGAAQEAEEAKMRFDAYQAATANALKDVDSQSAAHVATVGKEAQVWLTRWRSKSSLS